MLKVYTIFYNISLVSFMLLSFLASIIVGAAGHVYDYKVSDYIAYLIMTATAASLFLYSRQIVTSSLVKYVNITLVSLLILPVAYIMTVTIKEGGLNLIILIGMEFLFIILSIALIRALIKHKPTSYNSAS